MADKKFSEMTQDEIVALISPARSVLIDEVAEMIADWFGRSVIDADLELAAEIIDKIESRS